MSDPVITAEHLSKRYLVGHQSAQQEHVTFRELMMKSARGLVQKTRSIMKGQQLIHGDEVEEFWAVKDVSFEINRGDVVALIGRNGAGKSTLLKILSRITSPTEGQVHIRGRLASLLEVGTGFHPELTGRENIYLNGTILGMSRGEIRRKFDEIVEFAEMAKFLDTPVKRYSSGMYVRLAFAVAAHLEPEILIVDEVLAVGDADFQRKCLGKMDRVAKEGRTVLVVSHNMAMLQTLCTKGILLERGTVSIAGEAQEVIGNYLSSVSKLSTVKLADRTDRRGNGKARVMGIRICSESGGTTLVTGQAVRFEFEIDRLVPKMTLCFTVYNQSGQALTHFNSSLLSSEDALSSSAGKTFICEAKPLLLLQGTYWINVALLAGGESLDHVEAAHAFQVEAGLIDGRLHREKWGNCDICMPHRWTLPQT
jgi:lipopolysaccharide transport system ATP-binding protein